MSAVSWYIFAICMCRIKIRSNFFFQFPAFLYQRNHFIAIITHHVICGVSTLVDYVKGGTLYWWNLRATSLSYT